jgi:hypothetical protein
LKSRRLTREFPFDLRLVDEYRNAPVIMFVLFPLTNEILFPSTYDLRVCYRPIARNKKMKLLTVLRRFDGKKTEPLVELADNIVTSDNIDELLAISEFEDARLQVAATWVLKRCQDNGISLSKQSIETLIDLLARVTYWEAQLHLLQMLSSLTIPSKKVSRLWKTSVALTGDANNFVRAWSYNLLAEIGDQHARRQKEVLGLLETADQDAAASVRARIRQIRKHLKWTKIVD